MLSSSRRKTRNDQFYRNAVEKNVLDLGNEREFFVTLQYAFSAYISTEQADESRLKYVCELIGKFTETQENAQNIVRELRLCEKRLHDEERSLVSEFIDFFNESKRLAVLITPMDAEIRTLKLLLATATQLKPVKLKSKPRIGEIMTFLNKYLVQGQEDAHLIQNLTTVLWVLEPLVRNEKGVWLLDIVRDEYYTSRKMTKDTFVSEKFVKARKALKNLFLSDACTGVKIVEALSPVLLKFSSKDGVSMCAIDKLRPHYYALKEMFEGLKHVLVAPLSLVLTPALSITTIKYNICIRLYYIIEYYEQISGGLEAAFISDLINKYSNFMTYVEIDKRDKAIKDLFVKQAMRDMELD